MEQLITSLLSVGIFIAGYYLGRKDTIIIREDKPEQKKSWIKRIKESIPHKKEVGAVERPSAEDLERMNNPLIKGEHDAMSETLRDIIRP